MEPNGRYYFDVIQLRRSGGQAIVVATSPEYESPQWLIGGLAGYRYLGPTPTETPSPARTPATALPPTIPTGAVAGAGGPPSGFVSCRMGCGVRWTGDYARGCWDCIDAIEPAGSYLHSTPDDRAATPDWTPTAGTPGKYAPSSFTVESVNLPAKPTRPAGITCPRCLCTSEGGAHHLEACPRGDFLPRDAGLTSAEWSARVSALVLNAGLVRRAKSRVVLPVDRRLPPVVPFVPEVDDYDLFGRNVR